MSEVKKVYGWERQAKKWHVRLRKKISYWNWRFINKHFQSWWMRAIQSVYDRLYDSFDRHRGIRAEEKRKFYDLWNSLSANEQSDRVAAFFLAIIVMVVSILVVSWAFLGEPQILALEKLGYFLTAAGG